MRFLIKWTLLLAIILPYGFVPANAALTDYDRQENPFVNILADKNPGFESGTAQWIASTPSTLTTSSSNPGFGKLRGVWDSTASGQTLKSALVAIPQALRGINMEASCFMRVPSGTATTTFGVTDGTNPIPSAPSQTIPNSTNFAQVRTLFVAPTSGSLQLLFTSVASNEPAIDIDGCYLGFATGVGIAQVGTPWASYSLTIGATTTAPTPGTNTALAQWHQVNGTGDIEISYNFQQTSAGSAGSGTYLFPIPAGMTIDTTKNKISTSGSGNDGQVVGTGSVSLTTTVATQPATSVFVVPYNSTSLAIYASTGTILTSKAVGDSQFGLGNTPVYISFTAKVSIVGLNASTVVTANQQRTPKVTTYGTAGTFTHTTTLGAVYMTVEAVGPGGGGASGGSGGAGGNAGSTGGTNTSFGGTLIVANAGGGGQVNGAGVGGAYTINSPAIELFGSGTGNAGSPGNTHETNASFDYLQGGTGGSSCMGSGAGYGGAPGSAGLSATAAGSGGGGGGSYGPSPATTSSTSGGGGGAGGCAKARIDAPASTYAVVIPGAVNGGTAVGIGGTGGNGAAGKIVVTEYFGATTALLANSVSTSNQNGERTDRVTLTSASQCTASPCTISSQSGGISSVTRSATGHYLITFLVAFSSAPTCIPTTQWSTAHLCAYIGGSTTTAIIYCGNTSSGGADVDSSFTAICSGPR